MLRSNAAAAARAPAPPHPTMRVPKAPLTRGSRPTVVRSPVVETDTQRTRRRTKVHMHPVKRRLLFVLALGSLLGGMLMVATVRLVVAPLNRWSVSSLDAMTQLERLDVDVEKFRDASLASAHRMKLFLQQLQKLHAVSATRTGLVEKAAAQSYREHARDRLRQHFMAIKEGILLQTSQRRRIDDARLELRQMNLTAELLELQLAAHSDLMDDTDIDAATHNSMSASSLLAKSIRDIRMAMMEHSVDPKNATMDELAAHVEQVLAGVNNFTRVLPDDNTPRATPPHDDENGLLVYVAVFGVMGAWLWSVVTDKRTRKTSFVFHMHRAFIRAISNLVIVERVDDSTDEEDF